MTHHRLPLVMLWALVLAMPAFAEPLQQEDEPSPPDNDGICDPDVPDDPDCKPPFTIIATGGGGGGGGGSAVTFDWDGPDRLDFGVYDHGCLNYEDEFRRLVNINQGLIGSVPSRAASWDQALATMRARLDEPLMRAAYDTVRDAEEKAAIPLAVSDSDASLAQFFAAFEAKPDDPTRLFNFAGALNRSGMPNEALAVLARIRALGKLPDPTLEVSGSAAMDYQEGYAEMLRGNLAAAKSKLQATIAQEPFINAASHSLALIQAQEGSGAASITYRKGMWRFKPKYLVVCGGADSDSDEVRPPVDDMFDTSKGKDVQLVEFWHPEISSELEPFFEQIGALAETHLARLEPLKQQMIALSNNPRFAGGVSGHGGYDEAYNAWAEKMMQLINSLDEDEPYVLQAKAKLDAALAKAGKVAGQNQAEVLQKIVALIGKTSNMCPTIRSIVSQGVQGVRPHAEAAEAAAQEYASVWYKMATGLLSNIGDPEWFEMIDVGLRAEIEGMNLGLLATTGGYYAFPADSIRECPEEFVQMFAGSVQPPGAPDPCSALFGNQTLDHKIGMPGGFPGPSFNVSIGCKEIKVDGKFNLVNAKAPGGLAEFEMGARVEASFKKGQGFDMYAGVGADAKVLGQSGSARAGVFVSGDAQGLTDAGGRVKLNKVDGTKETMNFGMIAKPGTASRGPRLKNFWSPR